MSAAKCTFAQQAAFECGALRFAYAPYLLPASHQYIPETAKTLLDAEVGYRFSDAFKLALGARNLLDEFPDAKIADIRPLISPSRDETGTG